MLWRFFIFAMLSWAFAASAAEPLRPFPVKQGNPIMLRFLDPIPFATPRKDSSIFYFTQSYSSIFLADQLPNQKKYVADMELYIMDFTIAHRLTSDSSVYINIPLMMPLAGALDPFLRQYHQRLGLPNGGREARPDNSFAYQYSGASEGWNSQSRWEMGNIQAQWRKTWGDEEKIQTSSALSVKIPTGSSKRGWGHAGIDLGAAIIQSWQDANWKAHAELWWIHPFARQDFGSPIKDYLRSTLSLGHAAKLLFNAVWVVQVQGGTSPYKTGIAPLDQPPWLVSAGFQHEAINHTSWNFAFTENITQRNTQDFGVSLQVARQF